ncbi:MAG: ABC transporter ATP-binding protein [Candidatus Sericytochromatia bacterium]|nr:ABC transporter ATP-binding protein [Candidatus Sericytochromatia bacterium]
MAAAAVLSGGGEAPVLAVRGLTKRFGAFTAVDGIDFDVRRGEIVGLLGPNGAGKTTTMQMLLGLLTPSAGHITCFGLDLDAAREAVLSRLNFSSTYVNLPYSLTPRENLMVFAGLYGVRGARARVADVIAELGLSAFADKPTKALSSGQLTRLHLAKALLNRPELLLLDEPTASLDPDTADRIRTHLRGLRERDGLTILVTSHNMPEMEALCDRILFLQAGRIAFAGTPTELIASRGVADLEALFLAIAREDHPA